MSKARIFAGTIAFGSIWGLLECLLGPHIPGTVMTGLMALGLMAASRLIYHQKGMQLGMALIAAALRAVNPLGGCLVCAVVAIASEGAIFELVWFVFSLDTEKMGKLNTRISVGVITAYSCYALGYILTQIITPLISSVSLKLGDVALLIPVALSRGMLAASIGGVFFPVLLLVKQIRLSTAINKAYYPSVSLFTAACWFIAVVLV